MQNEDDLRGLAKVIKITNIHRVLILRRNLWLIMMLSLLLIGI